MKFNAIVSEIRSEVGHIKNDLGDTKDQLKSLKNEHIELERGVAAMDIQLHALELETLEKLRQDVQKDISALNQKQILLEKHERKYNILIYGVEEKPQEDMMDVLFEFMSKSLEIDEAKVRTIPIANAHRIPSLPRNDGRPKRPNPIIMRLIHFHDKEFLMSKGYKLAGKRMRILDDLPVVMKQARSNLANIAYKIRQEETLQTRIRDIGTEMILETRQSSGERWSRRYIRD